MRTLLAKCMYAGASFKRICEEEYLNECMPLGYVSPCNKIVVIIENLKICLVAAPDE